MMATAALRRASCKWERRWREWQGVEGNESKTQREWSSGERQRETDRQRMMSEGEERGGKFKEILLIKRESTTQGDGINQSFALMRHLLIMPGRGRRPGERRKESAGL